MAKTELIRCAGCGRFISNDDIDKGLAKFKHTPDTPFSAENNEWFCAKCNEEVVNGK